MKNKVLSVYIILSFLLMLGTDLEYSSPWAVAAIWVNFAIAALVSRRVNFDNTNS